MFDEEERTLIALATSSASLDRSPKKNWVENNGGLPPYIRKIARAVEKTGRPLSQAIEIAIGKVKDWAAGGDNVTPKTQAKAAAALAAWTALKGRAKGKKVSLSIEGDVVLSSVSPTREFLIEQAWGQRGGDIVEYNETSIVVSHYDQLTDERWLEGVEFAEYGDEGILFADPVPLEDTFADDPELTEAEEQDIASFLEKLQ